MYPWHKKQPEDMQPHHAAWLDAHPNRTTDWLQTMCRAGFDVHHIDGDHDNNDPANLVLIEHGDHMMLHSMMGSSDARRLSRVRPKKGKRKGRVATLSDGRVVRLRRRERASDVVKLMERFPQLIAARMVTQ